jgi:hypothetical protein
LRARHDERSADSRRPGLMPRLRCPGSETFLPPGTNMQGRQPRLCGAACSRPRSLCSHREGVARPGCPDEVGSPRTSGRTQ